MNLARPNVSVGTIGKKMGELIESVELEGHGDLKGKKLRVNQVIDIFGYRNS